MSISSPGIGSNLDVNGIVTQLMTVEQAPLTALTKKESSCQAKISAMGSIKSALSSFQSAVKGLSDTAKFQGIKASSTDGSITAAAFVGAVPGSYSIEVSQLAQAQKLTTSGQTDSITTIGTGTLTFDFGTISGGSFDSTLGKYTGASFASSGTGQKSVVIDAGHSSLAGIRDAINSAQLGVTATIINDGSATPSHLVLTDATTGAAHSIKISVAGDPALTAFLAHDPGLAPSSQALRESVSAQDAKFKIDGTSVIKSSNSFSDVVDNLSMTLTKTNVGSPATVSVARDSSSVQGAIGQFVYAYNQINQTLTSSAAYDPSTKKAAIFNGDAAIRGIQTAIRNVLTAPVSGGASTLTLLSQVGVSVQKDGTLSLDNTKLQAAMDSNYSQIAGVFASTGSVSDSLTQYASATSATKPGSYAVNVTTLAAPASVTGSSQAGLTISAGVNDNVTINLNGTLTSVTLSPNTYATPDALATELQSKINGSATLTAAGAAVKVTNTGGVLSLTSTLLGSNSTANLSGSAVNTLFGVVSATSTGQDVTGTLNGTPATGSGNFLTGLTGSAAEGLKLVINGGLPGGRGTVNYSQGYASQFDKLVDSFLGTTGAVNSRLDGLNTTLKSIKANEAQVSNRLTSIEARYRAQFTALDVAISNMTKTSSFLTQQLAALSANSK